MTGRRLRILHVSQPTEAGVARCVVQLAAAQRAAGHAVTVAGPADPALQALLEADHVSWARWEATRSPGPTVPAEVRALGRVVRHAAPDLVHLHSSKAGLCGRLLLRGRLPTVFQPHAWSFSAVSGPLALATRRWERHATRWAALTVLVSEAERVTGLDAGVRPRRTVVVPNGVDLEALPPAGPSERADARRRLGLGQEKLVVCVGRLAHQKGQDVLLDAWPIVRRAAGDAALVLVGDGPEAAVLRGRAVEAVQLVGARSDVPEWLAAADVVVVPSRWEGMALVPLEAMARARSVVVTDVAGARESVPPGCGAVVPVEDARALGAALAERLGGQIDPDAEGQSGRTHVERRHDVRTSTAAITKAYRPVLRTCQEAIWR